MMVKKLNFHVNSFVRRQTPQSQYSHFIGSDEELLRRVSNNWRDKKQGYREGVVLVPVEPEGFYTPEITLKAGDKFGGEFASRREGEFPRKEMWVSGREKEPAVAVDIVLYSSMVLSENGDNELPAEEANWEVISINARPSLGEQPIRPGTLMANHFGADGGTNTNMTPEEFVEALKISWEYWKDKMLVKPSLELPKVRNV